MKWSKLRRKSTFESRFAGTLWLVQSVGPRGTALPVVLLTDVIAGDRLVLFTLQAFEIYRTAEDTNRKDIFDVAASDCLYQHLTGQDIALDYLLTYWPDTY